MKCILTGSHQNINANYVKMMETSNANTKNNLPIHEEDVCIQRNFHRNFYHRESDPNRLPFLKTENERITLKIKFDNN